MTVTPLDSGLAKFDFGTTSSAVASNYTRVSRLSMYDSSTQFGWATTSPESGNDEATYQTDQVLEDFVRGNVPNTFLADLPYGTYNVTLQAGSWLNTQTDTQVTLEGSVVDTFSTALSPTTARYHTGSYTNKLIDGQLTVDLQDSGPDTDDLWRINGLTATPSSLQMNRTGGAITYTEKDPLTPLLPSNATVLTPDGAFNGGGLTISGATSPNDRLEFAASGTGPGQISVDITASTLSFGGQQIATYSGGVGTTALSITFNAASGASVSSEAVMALVRTIGFRNANLTNLAAGSRSLSWSLTDGDGGSTPLTKSVTVNVINDSPTISAPTGPVTYTEDAPPVLLMPSVIVNDPDSASLNAGSLIVAITSGGGTNDRLAIINQGTGSGQIGVSGTTVTYGGLSIGTVANNNVADPANYPLTVTFTTANATKTAAQALVRAITFENINHSNPTTNDRLVAFTISDGAGNTSQAQTVHVVAVNDTPTISNSFTSQTLNEDGSVGPISFTLGDVDSDVNTLQLSASSDNAALLPVGSFVFSGSGANRTLTVTPAANQSGVANITVTVNDSGTVNATATRTFQLTVNAVNDAPTLILINDVTVNEDTSSGPIGLTVNDVDSSVTNLLVTATSNNPGLIPASGVVLGGTGANRTLTLTPASDQFGSATITVTVDDGTGSATATTTRTFQFTVNAVDDPPTISAPGGSVTYTEDAPPVLLMPSVVVNDIDSASLSGGSLIVAITSGGGTNDRLAIKNQGTGAGQIGFSGTTVMYGGLTIGTVTNNNVADPANYPLTVTFTTTAATKAAAQALVRAITFENVNHSNPLTNDRMVGFTISDSSGNTSQTQTVHVVGVNDAPTISSSFTNQTINEDGSSGPISFTIGDVDTDVNTLQLSATSDNGMLLPTGSFVFSGSGTSRTLIVTPAANQSGVATITVTLNDGSTTNATATRTFQLAVNAVNDAPTITNSFASQSIDEDGAVTPISFTIGDVDTAITSLQLAATSDNPTLLPAGSFVFSGSGTSRTLTVTPAANQSGVANITVTVNDGSTNNATATRTFQLTVNAVNDAPTLVALGSVTIDANASSGPIALTVDDVDSSVANLLITATSNNPGLIPATGVVLAGSGANRTLILTPAADQFGTATITVTVDDGTASATATTFRTFQIVVNQTAPIAIDDSYTLDEDTNLNATRASLLGNDTDPNGATLTQWEKLCDPAHGMLYVNQDGSFTYVPTPNYSGPDSFTYRVSDGQRWSQPAMVSLAVTPVDDVPTITNNQLLATVPQGGSLALNQLLATVAAADNDLNDVITYTITAGNDDEGLSINADGEVRVADPYVFDFGMEAVHTYDIVATDSGGLSAHAIFTLSSESAFGFNEIQSAAQNGVYAIELVSPVSFVSWTLNWGDGSPSATFPAGSIATHTYQSPDDVSVTATATGGGSTATAIQNIVVEQDPAVNLLVNGGFENPYVSNSALWDVFELIPGWSIDSRSAPDVKIEVQRGVVLTAGEGSQSVELDADQYGPNGTPSQNPAGSMAIGQWVVTVPGETYELSFLLAARPNTSLTENAVNVRVNGGGSDVINQTFNASSASWTRQTITFVANSASTRIILGDAGATSNGVGTLVDDVRLVVAQPITFTVGNATYSESDDGTIVNGQVPITLSRVVAGGYMLSYSFLNGTAIVGQDYAGTAGTLYFSVDSATQYISFQVLDDAVHDPEQFYIKVTDQQTSTTRNGTVQLIDADTQPNDPTFSPFDLTWNVDDNTSEMVAWRFAPNAPPQPIDGNSSSDSAELSSSGASVDWGDDTSPDTTAGIHYYDQGEYTIMVYNSQGSLIQLIPVVVSDSDNPVDSYTQPGIETYPPFDSSFTNEIDDIGSAFADTESGTTAVAGIRTPDVIRLRPFNYIEGLDRTSAVAGAWRTGDLIARGKGGILAGVYDMDITKIVEVRLGNGIVQRFGTTDPSYSIIEGVQKKDNGTLYIQGGNAKGLELFNAIASQQRANTTIVNTVRRVAELQDYTFLDYVSNGDWGRLTIRRPGAPEVVIQCYTAVKNIGIRGAGHTNNDIDRLDAPGLDTIIEEKDGRKLDHPKNFRPDGTRWNPDATWARTHIFNEMSRRLDTINSGTSTFKKSDPSGITQYYGPDRPPSVRQLKNLTKVRFEVMATRAELKDAIELEIDNLRARYGNKYTFSVEWTTP